jgi:hypothetical protein
MPDAPPVSNIAESHPGATGSRPRSKALQRLLFCLQPFDKLKDEGPAWRLIGLLVAFGLLVLLSFALLSLSDRINASGMVVTRFMARGQAPLTAHFYPAHARDQITVVLYDPAFLRSTGSAWPIRYGDHADWLLRLATTTDARPRAILLDVTFGQERADDSLPALQDALCALQIDYGIPVFLAALASVEDGRLHVRRGLSPTHPESGQPCFTLVDVGYTADPLDRLVWTYPLTRYLNGNGWQHGPPSGPEIPALQSAAMRIASDAAGIDLGPETDPMALVWGLHTPDLSDRPELLGYCREGVTQWSRLIPGLVRNLFVTEQKRPICPYHRTLSMAQVGALPEEALAPLVADRYLMVGAFVPGYNDLISSPIHGLIPGVYMHAMALDNLLTYQDRYKLSTDWSDINRTPELWKAGLAAVAAVFAVHLVWSVTRSALLAWPTFRNFTDRIPLRQWYVNTRNLPRRLAKLLLGALSWLLKRMAQAAAALLLIASLQDEFRIGMLPVVELVTMTLVAEGLNMMARIRRFLGGEDDAPPPGAAQRTSATPPTLSACTPDATGSQAHHRKESA